MRPPSNAGSWHGLPRNSACRLWPWNATGWPVSARYLAAGDDRRGELPNVRDAYSTQQKSTRILEAFDAKLAAEELSMSIPVYRTPFVQELEDWYPDKSAGHDDCLDAVAGALSLQPASLPRRSISGEVKLSAVTALSASAAQLSGGSYAAVSGVGAASGLRDFRV